ncbi:RNA polymerase subunit sigma-70 [Actinoplanes friuliensis]|uniref:RNA polymerase subunit sigma-70 n=1 Tax=Actinoplanes friuliensis TaxID=196914 RepID=UPI001930DB67|nr:RNA polymerase subunit sigma-70 [Actinoplanes friuliensis]
MTTDLVSRARAGDGEAFRALTAPHQRELHVHCYRMLGSLQDAEDALQDTLLAAWQGLGAFEGRASVRTWLYRIATNRCLNVRRAASRRPVKVWDMPGAEMPEPTRLGEITWLEPWPDELHDPEARYEQTETMSLAFVTALQVLPSRQVAVLVLRDVLDFSAAEVAEMLGMTVDAANSALKRARAALRRQNVPGVAVPGPSEEALVARFVRAYTSGDVAALIELFTDDAVVSMPPIPLEYQGHEALTRLFTMIFESGRRVELMPVRANGQPAFGAYLAGSGSGLFVLTLAGDRISAFTRFEAELLPRFGLSL